MHFTSLIYLAFLPTVLLAYHLCRHFRLQNTLLLVSSYVFYGWWDYRFCLLMLASSLVDFVVGRALHREEQQSRCRALLTISIVCNLGLLATFKYLNFFIESAQELGAVFGFNMVSGTLDIILPVGISFYTFQTMSYTLDIYRRQLKPADSLIDYLAFVSFFPQLVAGPIERASHLLPQLQRGRNVSWSDSAAGVRQILCGFFKKIVIADSVATFVSETYLAPSDASGAALGLATVFFAFQIYCDFSAYSDIAIGTARMFGIELMQNFAYPYFARSINEFWQRWHISLSTWFRDYVYIPLGGNRGSAGRRNWNVLLTFIISGFWHGAAWRFLGWGALHGSALVVEKTRRGRDQTQAHVGECSKGTPRNFRHTSNPEKQQTLRQRDQQTFGQRLLPSPGHFVRMAATFVVVCMGWVLFRAESMADAIVIWKKILASLFSTQQWQPLWLEYTSGGPLFYTINLLLGFVVVEWLHRTRPFPLDIGHWPTPLRWPAYTLVLWFIVEHSMNTPQSPFIYFQF